MKLFAVVRVFSFVFLVKNINAADYVEVPFQKFTVFFSIGEKPYNHSKTILPMNFYGETFFCRIPSDEELLSSRNFGLSNIGHFSNKINAMPCLMHKDSISIYLVCPDRMVLQLVGRGNFFQLSLGTRFTDRYSKKKVHGFEENGDRYFFIRHFTNGSLCDINGTELSTEVHFFCKQTKEESIFEVSRLSKCEYAIYIYTSRACSGLHFESEQGYAIDCVSDADAMDVVLSNNIKGPSSNGGYIFENILFPKDNLGDVYFVAGANFPLNKTLTSKEPSPASELQPEKKPQMHRADEILNSIVGDSFDARVIPENKSSDMEFFFNNLFYLDILNTAFDNILRNRLLSLNEAKKSKKKG